MRSSAASRPARCVQPIAASMIGSCAKLASTNESGEPDAIDANSNAEAAPAPSADENDLHHRQLSRSFERLEAESDPAPTIDRRIESGGLL